MLRSLTPNLKHTMSNFSLLLLIFFTLLFSLKAYISYATTDTISLTSSITGNQTLISKEGKFELGFFKPTKNSSNYYIGIWYKNIPTQTVVWVANRVEPITDPNLSQLQLSNDGNLVLLNTSNHQIWSTDTNSKATYAVLLDTSNLVLTNGSGSIVWQSFDHPADTWMPGGRVGYNKITQEYNGITCWESYDNPAPCPFTERLDPDGSNQYVILWNRTETYWKSGLWTGKYFSQVPNTGLNSPNFLNVTFTNTWDRKYATYTLTDNSMLARSIINSNGQLQILYWINNTQEWQPIYTEPSSQCNVYSFCGSYGICDITQTNICSCIKGFEPLSEKDWKSSDFNKGCVRKTKLQCRESNNTHKDGFIKMGNVRLPDNALSLSILGEKECEYACLKNCSCVAHSYYNGCLIWTKEIRNLEQFYGIGNDRAVDLYIRMAASDLPNLSYSPKILIRVAIGIVVGLIIILFSIFSVILFHRKWRRRSMLNKVKDSLIMFSYSDLQILTKNFSESIGSGGFGSVFKGWLPDQTEVAVKRLEGSNQGEKQFQTEVSTLAAIQHINLIKLRGFCSKTNKRLVVYEYMSGGSLGFLLFKETITNLSWKMRYQIILGIARGVAYLHEECRETIIHCDIKPDNILLDSNYCAKVADFGMAKLIGHDFSRVLTTIRGTIGYLAPEWFTGQSITTKVDVYSFGMMLFEIISGKRNTRNFEEDNVMGYFPYWAAKRIDEDNIVELLDERLQGLECDMNELKRVCRIALWCIQDSEFHRPSMSQVVKGLEGVLEISIPPIPRALEQYSMWAKMLSTNYSSPLSDNEISED
ncbi:hypothetical protein LUZ60_010642 [Juncus effusus]|nr:hypothetical protein LUZ60_010642 [Juncus effusus]